jgi:hypothetical protein
MEAVRASETSVDNHFTRQYIPGDNSEHHTRRRENLKSHTLLGLGGLDLNPIPPEYIAVVVTTLSRRTISYKRSMNVNIIRASRWIRWHNTSCAP